MKVSLGDLEEARHDLRAYLRRKRATRDGLGFNPRSKFLTLKRAIYCYHKRNNDLTAAHDYFEENYLKQFKRSPQQLGLYAQQLEAYANDFRSSRATVFAVQDRLAVALPQELTDAGVSVTGEIPRVDMTQDGYIAWLFAKETDRWDEELRLPIIQVAYAHAMGASEGEIRVGVYDFSKGEQKSHSFSTSALRAAERELHSLLREALEIDASL